MRAQHSRLRKKTAKKVMPPIELIRALRLDIADLRPNEYDTMESDRYQEVLLCQYEYRSAMKQFPVGWDTAKPETSQN